MPLDDAGSPTVRPMADFELALDQALAPLDRIMGPRQRGEALARARREILAAAGALVAAERRRVVQATTVGGVAQGRCANSSRAKNR
jgi:hypothetical protein